MSETPQTGTDIKNPEELEKVVHANPTNALRKAHYSPQANSTHEQRMYISMFVLREPSLPHIFNHDRRIMICKPLLVIDHLSATLINLMITPELNATCQKFLDDVKLYYPEKYPAYVRDIGRLAAGRYKLPPEIPNLKDENFEDPFNIGTKDLKRLRLKITMKETKVIANHQHLKHFPSNMHAIVQTNVAISLIDKILKWQISETDAFAFWLMICRKFDRINYELKFRVFLSLHNHLSKEKASQIFGDLIEEFFTSAPNGSRNNITMLLSAYYHTAETNDIYFTGHVEARPALKQHFIDLVLEGSELERAFALKVLAGYVNKTDSEQRTGEIINAIFPEGNTNHTDAIKLSAFLINITHPRIIEIATNALFPNNTNKNEPPSTSAPLQTPPKPTAVETVTTGYRFMIAETIRRRLSPQPRQTLPYEQAYGREVAERIDFFEDAMADLFKTKDRLNPTNQLMLELMQVQKENIRWGMMNGDKFVGLVLDGEDTKQLQYLCILPPGHPDSKTLKSCFGMDPKNKIVDYKDEKISKRLAAAITMHGILYMTDFEKYNPNPEDPESWYALEADCCSVAVFALEFLSGEKLLTAANAINRKLDFTDIDQLLEYAKSPKKIEPIITHLSTVAFNEPAQSQAEKITRPPYMIFALCLALIFDKYHPDQEKAKNAMQKVMRFLRSSTFE